MLDSFVLGQVPTTVYTADEVASPYIYVFYAAFLVAFLFTPIMQTVANYYGIIDEPDNKRKMHSAPVAYLDGVAVLLGWIGGMAVIQILQLHRAEPRVLTHLRVPFSIVVGATIIVILGLWDDIRYIPPKVKIGGQVFAAACLLFEGVGIHCTRPLLEPLAARITLYFNVPVMGTAWFPYV